MDKSDSLESKIYELTQLEAFNFDEVKALILNNDSGKLREIILDGRVRDINMRDKDADELLSTLACRAGSIECFQELVDYHPRLHTNDDDLYSSMLQLICDNGNDEMLRYFIERGISDKVIFNTFFNSVDMSSKTEVFSILVDHIDDVNYKADSDDSFLPCACRHGNKTIVQKLLDRGACIGNVVGYYNPLEAASCRGHADIVQLLLTWNGGQWVSKDRLQRALELASEAGFVSVIECLISYGVDADNLNAVLYTAVEANRPEAAACLLDHGADPYAATAHLYSTMSIACSRGSTDMVRLLLSRGADPNGVDSHGESPLSCAVFNTKLTSILLDLGTDFDKHFFSGSTALLDAVQSSDKNIEYLSFLLGHLADPNLAHRDTGVTALMIAAVNRRIDYMKILLEYGADVTQVSRDGSGVLDMLDQTAKYRKVVKLCTQYIDRNMPDAILK